MNSDKLTLVDVRAMKHLRENDPDDEDAKVAALCDAYLRLVEAAQAVWWASEVEEWDESWSAAMADLRALLPEEGDDANT